VHILRGKSEIRGSPFAMEAMKDTPTWLGRPYRFRTKLAAGDDYSYFFTARDVEGNKAPRTLTRRGPTVDPGGDIAAPDLSNIRVSKLRSDAATVQWATDEPATAKIEFGPDVGYGKEVSSKEAKTAHSIPLTGLTGNATYHYRISATDAAGNRAVSGDYTFRTPGD
jgi:hypothetical protein